MFRLCSTKELYSRKPSERALHPNVSFDLPAKFAAAHRDLAELNPFRTDKIKVAVHIRRGDVCWIEDGNKILFPFKNKEIVAGRPDKDLERALPVSYYMSVLDEISLVHAPARCEIRIYSDGYGHRLWGTLRAKDLVRHITGLATRSLRIPSRFTTRVSLFDVGVQRKLMRLRRELEAFHKYGPEVQFRIGQSVSLTKETMGAFGCADIIVVARKGAFPDLGLGLNGSQVVIHPGTNVAKAVRELQVSREVVS
jgi:hypothetical protein